MGRKRIPGLINRDGVWPTTARIRGRRLCESTGERSLEKAEFFLAGRIDQIRNAEIFGNRPVRSFRQAATKFLLENQHKRSIGDDAIHFRMLDPFIGGLSLRAVHRGSLQGFVDWRKKQGVKANTINLALKAVRRVLNRIAKSVVEEVRGAHPEFGFTHRGKLVLKINNSGWESARLRANLRPVRGHDLKHTFGRRLRAAIVSFTDR